MQSIVSGTWAEDFNYGYPYANASFFNNKALASLRSRKYLPPEFTYSGTLVSARGVVSSTKYARTDFTVEYLSPSQEPNNLDTASHAGAHALAPYYLKFPPLTWNETQMITLDIVLVADGYLTYDRSYDGHKNDRFFLSTNGHERKTVTHTAGHSWVTDSILLRKGRNKISWVVKTATYVPPVTRNGLTVSTTPPKVNRTFRLCRLTLTTVNAFPGTTTGLRGSPIFIDLDGAGTFTATPRTGAQGVVALSANSTLGYKMKNGICNMVGGATTTATMRSNALAQIFLLGNSAFGPTGSIAFSHSANDCGLELDSTGALTVMVPFNTPQTVTSLIRNLQSVSLTMNDPVFVNGIPVMPTYRDTQTTNVTTSGGYTYTDPVLPTSINHVLPVTPKYRWVATDLSGAEDSQVTSWAEHGGTGPAWTSNANYAPTINQHERFSDRTGDYVTYSRTVRFYYNSIDHMWLNMPATAFPTTVTNLTAYQPYTWVFVAMVHPMYAQDANVILDSYFNGASPADYTDSIDADTDVTVDDGTGVYRSLVQLRGDTAAMSSNTANTQIGAFTHNYKPVVYSAVFNGASSSLTAYGENYYQRMVGNTGSGSNYQQGFVLGRKNGFFQRRNASNMTLFEIAFYNRVLTAAEIKTVSQYLMGVYQIEKY